MSLIPTVSSRATASFRLPGLSENVIAEALKFLPEAIRFSRREDYSRHLVEAIPSLKKSTREGYAHLILRRYAETDPSNFLSRLTAPLGDTPFVRRVMCLHYLDAEPLASAFVEELLYPRIPEARITWTVIRAYVTYKRDEKDDVSAGRLKRALRRFGLVQKAGWGLLLKSLPADPELLIYSLLREYGQGAVLNTEQIAASRSRKRLLLTDAELTKDLMAAWERDLLSYSGSQITLSKSSGELLEIILKTKKMQETKEPE